MLFFTHTTLSKFKMNNQPTNNHTKIKTKKKKKKVIVSKKKIILKFIIINWYFN